MKIFGYYHIFAVNDYRRIVREQIGRLSKSGLLKKTDKFEISVIGQEEDSDFVKNELKNSGFDNFIISRLGFNCHEFFILNKVQADAICEDFYCYYIHTKGVSITNENASFYHGLPYETVKASSDAWRRAMEFFVIDNHETCIKELESGIDAVGMNLYTDPKVHFSGNFWWSKSGYVRTLLQLKVTENRYDCEFWIGSSSGGELKSLSQNKSGYSCVDTEYIEKFNKEHLNRNA